MKQNPLMIPQKKMAQNRNAFSRGFDTKINTSAGILTPVFSEPVLGSSKVRINRQSAFRSAQVNTAAFQEFDQFIDFFFVPFRQLFSYYGSMRTNTSDYVSNKLNVANVPLNFPHTSIDDITSFLRSDTTKDMFGFDKMSGALRLLDLFNLGTLKGSLADNYFVFSGQEFVPWYLLAYQKIWYDHYRNTSYIANDPAAYNMDNLVNSNGQVSVFQSAQIKKITELRYVPYRKDYFMSVYPSLNYSVNSNSNMFQVPSSVVQYVEEDSSGVRNFVPRFNHYQSNPDEPIDTQSPDSIQFNNSLAYLSADLVDGVFGTLSVQSIRAAFALDKLTRLAAYAPKHVADQFEVRFGFRPYAEDINESKRLGSFKASMSVTEVLSTADTGSDGAALGALGGRGLLSVGSGNTINFEVPEDGVILGLMYFMPRMSYDAGGIDSFAQVFSPVELPDPIFMNLGLEPVYQKELFGITYNLQNNPQDQQWIDLVNHANNMVLGYQERYKRFKCGISRNHGLFRAGFALSDFSIHTRSNRMIVPTNEQLSEDYGTSGVPANFFYVSPKDLDYIFVTSYDGKELEDQFFGMIRFDFDVVQPLSIHGQPTI